MKVLKSLGTRPFSEKLADKSRQLDGKSSTDSFPYWLVTTPAHKDVNSSPFFE